MMATSRCEGRLSQFVERSASKPILACVWGVRLQKDSKVYLYTGISINNKKGNVHYKQQLVEEPFRLIVGKSKQDPKKVFWFVTNDFELTAKQVADAYRRRWDIEVFFRFIKQELNVSHLVSLNKNGIQVILI
ncbi:MAG: transposase [Labilibaculum sp.]|nr:transposase [Labilibaculum sp.]